MAAAAHSAAGRYSVASQDQSVASVIVTSDSYRDIHPTNNASEFESELLIPISNGAIAEMHLVAMMSNWRVSPWVLQDDVVIPIRINVQPATLKYTFNYSQQRSFYSSLHYVQNQASFLDGAVTFQKGLNMYDHAQNWGYLSSGIRELWNSNFKQIIANTCGGYNNLLPSWSYSGVNFPTALSYEAILFVFGGPSACSIGSLVSQPLNNFGMVTTTFAFPTIYVPSSPNPAPVFYAAGWVVTLEFDFISTNPFTTITDGTTFAYNTDSNLVKLARLLNIPHDLLLPTAITNMMTSSQLLLEATAIARWVVSVGVSNTAAPAPLPILSNFAYFKQSLAPTQLTIIDGNNGFTTNMNLYGLTYLQNYMVATTQSPVPLFPNSTPQQPLIRMAQEPFQTAPLCGRLLTETLLTPFMYRCLRSANPLTFESEFFELDTQRQTSSQFLVTPGTPSFMLDNEKLYVMLSPSTSLNKNIIGESILSTISYVHTMSMNYSGLTSQAILQLPQVAVTLVSNNLVYIGGTSQANLQNFTLAYAQNGIIDYSVSQFMPFNYTTQSLGYDLGITIQPDSSEEQSSISFSLLNTNLEPVQVQACGNNLPFTSLALAYKLMPRENVSQSALGFISITPMPRGVTRRYKPYVV